MTTKNLIKNNHKFDKEYLATVVSNEDPLKRGRLQVIIESLLGKNPFWVDSSLTGGKIRLLLIPEKDDIITVKFRNKDIYSGVWELKGNIVDGTEENYIDPKKYGFVDNQGNFIIIDRTTNDISINSTNNFNVTASGVANITITGDANINCANANITASKTTINGDLDVTGSTNLQGSCVFEGITWKTHGHGYMWTEGAGSGVTDPPQ